MTVIDLVRDRTPATTKLTAKPSRWNLVMEYQSAERIACASCLLQTVFRMSAGEAEGHVDAARRNGRGVIMASSRDVVESKAERAEMAREQRALGCTEDMRRLNFRAEPA